MFVRASAVHRSIFATLFHGMPPGHARCRGSWAMRSAGLGAIPEHRYICTTPKMCLIMRDFGVCSLRVVKAVVQGDTKREQMM